MDSYAVKGDICNPVAMGTIESIPDGYLVVEEGLVKGVFNALPSSYRSLKVYDYSGHLVIPGMCDLHLHAPQFQFRGLWMDEELLEWLEKHTFPEEAKYADVEYARRAYTLFADKLLHSTTTRFSAFATIHRQATLLLCHLLEERGLRGYAGKVNMDRNAPSYLVEDTDQSIRETEAFLDECTSDLVKPIITPRFIPSCSDRLLDALGVVVRERNLPLQSHLSENLSEIEWVKQLCPDSASYADAYRQHGLWCGTPTIMAHCVWSDEYESELMESDNLFVAHCPDSNTNLASGVANIGYFIERGIRVGLGSDVAGGASLSLFSTCASAIRASKLRHRLFDEKSHILTFPEAFHLATAGGGEFFGRVGAFKEGYEADFTVLDESGLESTIPFSPVERLERYCYLSNEREVLHKAIRGVILF